tara:strand:+ start:1580 stop:4453 length:2874 start_codon:yes stop_codon:yes gene_type:complete
MAENIVSPGVFTRENDLSFLPQGIGAIGAAVVGPTGKGPAFVPTVIRRGFSEFEQKFGGLSPTTYVPQTVKEYLKNAGTVTVVRVLGGGGQNLDPSANTGVVGLAVSGANGNILLTTFFPSQNPSTIGLDTTTAAFASTNGIADSFALDFNGTGFSSAKNFSASLKPSNADYITKVIGANSNNSKTGADFWESSAHVYTNFKTLATNTAAATTQEVYTITLLSSATDTINTSSLHDPALGASGSFYLETSDGALHTVAFNTNAAAAATGLSGSLTETAALTVDANGAITASALATATATAIDGITGFGASATDNVVTVTADEAGNIANITTTFASTTASAVTSTAGTDAAGYPGVHADRELILVSQSIAMSYTSSYKEGYDHATTPWVTSGYQSGVVKDLIKFHCLNDGAACNTEYKVSITGLKEPGDIDGEEQYSTFNVLIRKFGDKDSRPTILEQFNNCNLDPDSVNYVARVIGDRRAVYSTTFAKVITEGDYPNQSAFCRVEVAEGVKGKSFSPKLSPKGFRAVYNPVNAAAFTPAVTFPSASYKSTQTIGTAFNSKAFLGFNFGDIEADNLNFCKPIPWTNVESNVSGDFNVEDYSGHAESGLWDGSLSASIDNTGGNGPTAKQLQFSVPFQGGYDGYKTSQVYRTGENIQASHMQGMDLSSTSATGYTAYKKAIDILSNQDEYDMNMLVLPGVIKEIHSSVTDAATTMVEDRGDTFYVMDLTKLNSKVTKAVSEASSLDSNYAAVYYPWVKVLDTSINKPVFVPPSVIVPGAIAASDNIAAEWFAPAGLNRGVLGSVLEAKIRLNQSERDSLYEGKVNPIATFPRTGVCIWGQKTLQTRPTALDRINVRRLLIAVKKFIASSSRYLVFEQNTIQTRNRFLNIVNPYLESVQQRQGLYAFRVQMDEGNNTPTEIDRNQLVGGIYLQPTKTAEYIILDFNILPTGATFGNGGSY